MQGHLAIEAALLVIVVVLLSQQAYRPGHKIAEQLTEKVNNMRSAAAQPPHVWQPCLHVHSDSQGSPG
jgi:hypothetical protein